MPTSSSVRFNACIPRTNTREPASGSRPCSASCTGTAGASGPKRKSTRGPSSSARSRPPRRKPRKRWVRRLMDRIPIQVLFVEDSEVDVELALRSLEQGGFEGSWDRVDIEEDLKRALGSAKPQAILSDFSMPRFDGIDALRLSKELAPGIPFIFLSGTIGEERAIEAIRLGATDYVLKNNMRRLGTVVKRALSEAGERERIRIAEEERARLVQILEATSDYVCMTDPAGTITYLNAAGRKLIGAPESQGAGKSAGEIYPAWAREPAGGAAGPEPGSLQTDQRELQPRRRRCAAANGRRPPEERRARRRHRGAARWRRLCGARDRSRASGRRPARGAQDPRGDVLAVLARGSRPARHAEHRGERVSARRRRIRHAPAQCRCRDAPRQGRRPQRLPVLRRRHDPAGRRPGRIGERAAARAGKEPDGDALPASGRARQRAHRRGRSADALEPRAARMDPPRPVRPRRGGLPPHPSSRGVRARRELPADPRLGRRRVRRAAARRERLGAAVPQPRFRECRRARPARG